MKNADITDIKWLSTGVMYLIDHKWFGPFKAHIKQAMTLDDGWIDPWLVETAEGSLLVVERSWIKSVPRKQGSPKKQRRVCKKGTKPNLGLGVPYDRSLITDGVHVVCRNGVRIPIDFSNSGDFSNTYHLSSFNIDTGRGFGSRSWDIIRIIVEEEKPKQDSYNGYSVGDWHFWDGKTSVPPVGKDVVVEYWLRSSPHKAPETQPARSLWWDWSNKHLRGSDIIAFKIVS